jgi:hypothetical protein
LAIDQVGGHGRQSIGLAARPTVFDHYIATFDVAGFAQARAKSGHEVGRLVWRRIPQETDHRACWLLCACDERPRCRHATQNTKKFSPPHRLLHGGMVSAQSALLEIEATFTILT